MTVYKGQQRVSSPYGPRIHPIYGTNGMHGGKDIVGIDSKSQRLVVSSAKVLSVNIGYNSGRGNNVVLQSINDAVHPNADVKLRYQHQASTTLQAGDVLYIGDVVGIEGSTGDSTGSHCHFEVTVNGTAVDPSPWDGLPNVAGTYDGSDDGYNEQIEEGKVGSLMILRSFGTKNMQGFLFPDANTAVAYDQMPNGYRVVTQRNISGTDNAAWEWVKLVDERSGQQLYTPLLPDRNQLLEEPLLLAQGDCFLQDKAGIETALHTVMEDGKNIYDTAKEILEKLSAVKSI